ncbi:uncharacterized protein LOC115231906, partial [Argonauta hians]
FLLHLHGYKFFTMSEENDPIINSNRRKVSKALSFDLRKLIIEYSEEGMGDTEISRILKVPRTTVLSIRRRYERTGLIESTRRGGGKPFKLTPDQKDSVRSWVDENPTTTLAELVERVKCEFGVEVCISTIKVLLKEFHYTVKSVLPVPAARNTELSIESRYQYALEYRNMEAIYGQESFVFVDESGFQVVSRRK